ncbi:MAG: AAA family ATPase [Acidobacteria bacterium]|nr:AAA family ATPase [Acidobacteriota bacterium]
MAIQLIVASADHRFHDFVREQLAHIPNADVVGEHEDMGPNLSVRILQDLNINPEAAVLLDISADREQGLRTLEQLRHTAEMYVVLSDDQCSEEFLLRSLRLGSSDFLQQPLKRAEFSDAMARLEQHVQRAHRQARPLGRMYTFVGVKGAMGTTTVAVNFAALSARSGKNTILLDLDLDSGDAACYLGLRHQYSLADVADNLDQLDQAMLEGIVVRDALGFSVLCAPEDFERTRGITEGHIRDIGNFLIERYDVVVVDGSRAMDSILMSCLELSESIFVVLTEEFPAVRNAQQYLTSLARAGYGSEAIKLIVNRHEKRGTRNVSLEQLQQTLGTPPFWVLPNQYAEAMQAVHEARPIVIRANTELGRAYRNFGKKLGFEGQPAEAAVKK